MSLSPSRSALTLAACLGLGAATAGCFVTDDGGPPPDPPAATPAEESVDTGATLKVTPGEGAGLFVEYAAGGAWDVFTACDTKLTGRSCSFDVILSADPSGALSNARGQALEAVDVLSSAGGTIHLTTGTAGGLDGVTFTADAGATLRIDMLLDGEAQPGYINWISGGLSQQGATTNPVDFSPTVP